jgi:MFS family permease
MSEPAPRIERVTALGELIAPRRLGRDFRWLMSAAWTSNIGDGIALAASPLLIASMTSSPVLVASGAMLQFLPWLLFGLHAGAIADRVERRMLVMLAHGVRAVIVLALVAFLVTGTANIAIVLAVSFLYGTAEVFADTSTSTLLPMMVKPADLGIGNARLQAGFLVANQLAGPLLVARIARQPVPPRSSAGTDPSAGSEPRKSHVGHDIAEGVGWAWRNKPVRTLIIIILAFNVTWAAPWGILVLYATEHLKMGPVGFGALTTASALGGLAATLSFGWLERHVSFATLMKICLSLEVLMHLSFALTTNGVVALGIMFGFGAYAFVWGTISTTVRQRLVPHELQGRVGSVNMVGVFGGMVIGQAVGGLIAQAWGLTAPWWFAFGGAALTLLLMWRQISHIAAAKPVLEDAPADESPAGDAAQ